MKDFSNLTKDLQTLVYKKAKQILKEDIDTLTGIDFMPIDALPGGENTMRDLVESIVDATSAVSTVTEKIFFADKGDIEVKVTSSSASSKSIETLSGSQEDLKAWISIKTKDDDKTKALLVAFHGGRLSKEEVERLYKLNGEEKKPEVITLDANKKINENMIRTLSESFSEKLEKRVMSDKEIIQQIEKENKKNA